jgi:ABC-type dipeptide/oligopeptide/nickel transport system permease subunit
MLDQLNQLWRNKTAVAGLFIVAAFLLAAIFAPQLSPHNPLEASLYDQLKPPAWAQGGSAKNILGTDDLGRDILSRIIYGARVSLLVAVVFYARQICQESEPLLQEHGSDHQAACHFAGKVGLSL